MSTEEVHDKEPVESAEGDESADGSMAKMRPRVERVLRSALAPRSMSKGVPVYVVAAVEKILSEVVAAAETNRAAKRKPRRNIDLLSLIAGVRNNPGLARAFRQYVFQATGTVKYDADSLLTKADRALAQAKRAKAAGEKQAKRAVPGMLED
jgi:hypothetical protein